MMIDDSKIELDENFLELLKSHTEAMMVKSCIRMLDGMDNETATITEGIIDILFKHGLSGEQVLGIFYDIFKFVSKTRKAGSEHDEQEI